MKAIINLHAIGALLMILLLGACSLKEAPPLQLYAINPPNPKPVKKSPYRNDVMKVSYPLSSAQPLTYKMIYSYNRREWGYYQNSQWVTNVGKQLQGNFIHMLQAAKMYKAVVPFEATVPEDLRLESVVHDFYHDVSSDHSDAVVSIEFSLVDMRNGKLIKNRRFSYKEPTPTVDAKGYVKAVHRAMERLGGELTRWLKR